MSTHELDGEPGASPFRLVDDNAVYTDGNVGIGTDTPAEALSVVGNIDLTGNMHTRGVLHVGGEPASTTPLTVTSASDLPAIAIDTFTDDGGTMVFKKNGTQVGAVGPTSAIEGNMSNNFGVFAETGGSLVFYTNGDAVPKVVIDSSGKLGIGTNAPSEKLHVKGGNARIDQSGDAKGGTLVVTGKRLTNPCDATTQGAITYDQSCGENCGHFYGCRCLGAQGCGWIQLDP